MIFRVSPRIRVSTGQVLEVLPDDEGIKKDMHAWC